MIKEKTMRKNDIEITGKTLRDKELTVTATTGKGKRFLSRLCGQSAVSVVLPTSDVFFTYDYMRKQKLSVSWKLIG
jgi:energy-converting hydrogenase Eha subunit H